MQYPNAQILIFAKPPVAGQVKTRLAESIGPQLACEVYETLLQRTLDTVLGAQLAPVICYTTDTEHKFFNPWRHKGVSFRKQSGADLGERMSHAFHNALQQASAVLLLGSDCPVLSAEHVNSAIQALHENNDAVITPTADGGYILLGLKKNYPEIFSSIQWSSNQVFRQTVERFDALSVTWQQMDTLWDLDTPDDYQRWSDGLSLRSDHA